MSDNALELSDDEIGNMVAPPDFKIPEETSNSEEQKPQEEVQQEEVKSDEPAAESLVDKPDAGALGSDDDDKPADEDHSDLLAASDEELDAALKAKQKPEEGKPGEDKPKAEKQPEVKKDGEDEKKPDAEKKEPESQEPDYKAMYEALMAPFKASGRKIELQNPQEAKKLMQLGADYTKKMQALAPNLKIMKSLENAGLLNQEKINHLIDLTSKEEGVRKGAVQKLLKDNNIDPMDVDTSSESNYKPVNHAPSDKQMEFDTILDETVSTQIGAETVRHIEKEWDDKSKDYLIRDPKILQVMTAQRESGIYDQIRTEVNRQKDIGGIPVETPFLEAYKFVGDELNKRGLLKPKTVTPPPAQVIENPVQPSPKPPVEPKVIESRAVKPKPAVSNSDKAKAAAPTRTTPPKKSDQRYNPLMMSDDEIVKQTSFRL